MKISIDKALLEQVLDDLMGSYASSDTIKELRAALDAPAVEPDVWYDGRKFYATPSAAHMDCADIKALRPLYEAPQPQQPAVEPVAWVWNPAKESWERVHVFGHWQSGAIYAFGPEAPQPQQPAPVQEQQPVAWVDGRWYEDGTRAGNTLVWASRTADDDFPVGTNLYTAQPRKVVKLSEAEVRSLAKQCDEGGEDNEYLLALSNAIQDAFIAKNRWAE